MIVQTYDLRLNSGRVLKEIAMSLPPSAALPKTVPLFIHLTVYKMSLSVS